MSRAAFVSAAVSLEILWIVVVGSTNTRATPLLFVAVALLAAALIPSKEAAARTARQRVLSLAGFAFSIVVLLAAVIDWLPRAIIRELVTPSAQLLRPSSESGLKAKVLDVRRTILEENLVRNVRERVLVAGRTSDEQRILDLLAPLKRQLVNEFVVPHRPETWPVLLAGIGWCDQLNSVGAEMLAFDFPRSQVFALYDPQKKTSTHTIGRVWSAQRKEWLYFDIFFDDVVVFRLQNREPVLVARRKVIPAAITPYPDEAQQLALYRQSADGWVLADRFPTFVGQMTSWIRRAVSPSRAREIVAQAAPVKWPTARVFPAEQRVLDEFMEARIDDVFGDEQAAIAHYERAADLARRSGATLAEKAARHFVMLKATEPAAR